MADSELRIEICSAINFCYCTGKTATKTVMLMKEAYKDKHFSESTIFDVMVISKKNVCLQNCLLILGDQKMLWMVEALTLYGAHCKKNRQMIFEEIVASTNISKTSIFYIIHNNLKLPTTAHKN